MDLFSQIEQALAAAFPGAHIDVDLQGNKALVEITSGAFSGKNRVQRSKLVYQCLNSFISSGELHAVTIRASAPGEHG
jgi:acid stress-induced BolA-like protein IbaG/YrbA